MTSSVEIKPNLTHHANIEVSPSGKIINESDGLSLTKVSHFFPKIPKSFRGANDKTKGFEYYGVTGGGPKNNSHVSHVVSESEAEAGNSDTDQHDTVSGSDSTQSTRRKKSKIKSKLIKSTKKLAKSLSKASRSVNSSKSKPNSNIGIGSVDIKKPVPIPKTILKHRNANNHNQNQTETVNKQNTGPPPALFTTITPEFFTRLKQISTEANLVRGQKQFQHHLVPVPVVPVKMETLSNLERQSRENARKSFLFSSSKKVNKKRSTSGPGQNPSSATTSLTFKEAREALSLGHVQLFPEIKIVVTDGSHGTGTIPGGAAPTMIDPDMYDIITTDRNRGDIFKSKSSSLAPSTSTSKHQQQIQNQSSSHNSQKMIVSPVIPRNVKGFAVNPLNHSQSRITMSGTTATSSGKADAASSTSTTTGTNPSPNPNKPILLCQGNACNSTTFNVKKRLRFADSDGSAAIANKLDWSSSLSNRATKSKSCNLNKGCLK